MITAIVAIPTPAPAGVAPTVVSTGGGLSVFQGNSGEIRVAFSAAMDPATITSTTVKLRNETTAAYVTLSTVTPLDGDIQFNLTYPSITAGDVCHVEITTGAESALGVPLAAPYTSQSMTAYDD